MAGAQGSSAGGAAVSSGPGRTAVGNCHPEKPADAAAIAGGVSVSGSNSEAGTQNATTAMVPRESVALEDAVEEIGGEREPFSPLVARLPLKLDVMVPVRNFRVRDLLSLGRGQVIATQWGHGEDVPVASGEVPLAWSEFEVVENRLAVRITRLS